MPVKEGEEYHFYFFVQSDAAAGLTVALESEEGVSLGSSRLTLQKSGGYLRYDCDLTACGTDFKGRISISCDGACTVTLGFTSLMPKKTFKGHGLREDLAMALKNTHAKFIRFPGGCGRDQRTELPPLFPYHRACMGATKRPADVALPHHKRPWLS